MIVSSVGQEEESVLLLAPTNNDSATAALVLGESGVVTVVCHDVPELCAHLERTFGAVLVAEEALSFDDLHLLRASLGKHPRWSDIPIIVMTSQNALSVASSYLLDEFSKSGSISFLERPFARVTLVRTVEVALRARKRQYQVRALIEDQIRASRMRDEFLAALSHELRTPLTVILGWLEVLRKKDASTEDFHGALEILSRNAQSQKALIDDLLDTSRIISGKLFVQKRVESLTKIVKQSCEAFRPRAESAGVKLNFEIPDEQFMIEADDQRLHQVLANLLTNSIKFTPPLGEIFIRVSKVAEQYCITVRDTGRGIEAGFLPYIFDRLKQEDMSVTRESGGLGLGLSIAAYIVNEHDGKISAESEGRGHGTTVRILLPVPDVKAMTTLNEPLPQTKKSLKGLKVLVVDDSQDILSLVHLWLKKANAVVKSVTSASLALEVITDFEPDVLLSDIGMPGEDGYSLIKRVRSLPNEKLRLVPAGALTAYARDEERSLALASGFQMHISKPMSEATLTRAVAELAMR